MINESLELIEHVTINISLNLNFQYIYILFVAIELQQEIQARISQIKSKL